MSFETEAVRLGRITPTSIEAGKQLARLADRALGRVAETGEPDERCATCAFRSGTLPNQCADTISDAVKCVVEGETFYCHEKGRMGRPCYGWLAAAAVTSGLPRGKAPWPFSHEEGFSRSGDGGR